MQNSEKKGLEFFNTKSRQLEVFEPLDTKVVKMYSCGPTVYDNVTIGNLRSFVFADIIKRTLLYNGYEVNHTMNFTDFGHLSDDGDNGEDKMMKALRREDKEITLENMAAVAEVYIKNFKQDMLEINNLTPTQYTPASAYIQEQINLIKTLEEKGYTYETSDGIYFDISRFPSYGKLGNINVKKLKEGARVEVNTEKQHPADFALWKKAELGWDSDWGKGFPGWHIECTAMAFATLGEQIDIHTGGEDLAGTHHNGEIAQAEAATEKTPYVKYWMHNAFITINGNRLGKSEGNAITLSELKEKGFSPLDYRYWLLTAHYRSPVNFTFDALEAAKQARTRLVRFMLDAPADGTVHDAYKTHFLNALHDDLDTPKAIALIWDLQKDETISEADKAGTIREIDAVLALGLSETKKAAASSLGFIDAASLSEEVQALVADREEARKNKDFDTADKLRDELENLGYLIEDSDEGPKIIKK